MHCFVCAQRGVERAAVALCPHCWIALCMTHRVEAQQPGPGGMRFTCHHQRAIDAKSVRGAPSRG